MSRSLQRLEERRQREREQARAEARQAEARERALEEARERRREEQRGEERRAAARRDALDQDQAEQKASARADLRRTRLRERRRAESAAQARIRRSEDRVRTALLEHRREANREARREAERRTRLRTEAVSSRREGRGQATVGSAGPAAGRAREQRRADRRREARQAVGRAERQDADREAQRAQERRAQREEERRAERAEQRRDADREAQRAQERAATRRVAQQGEQARQQRSGERAAQGRESRRHAREATRRRAERPRPVRANAPRRSAQRIPTGVLSGTLPWLSVIDGLLVDEATEAVTLRGIALRGFARARATDGVYTPPLSEEEARTMASWGLTAVEVAIAADLALDGSADASGEAYLQALDEAVASAAGAGLYTVVELSLLSAYLPTAPGEGADSFDPPLPDPAALDLWGVLARRYADEPAVLFQVFRPPHDPEAGDTTGSLLAQVSPPRWSEWALACLSALRREHPRSLVVVPGAARGGELADLPLIRSDGTEPANVIYVTTPGTSDRTGNFERCWVELDRLGRTHPVGVVGWRPDAEPDAARAVVSTGQRLARAGWHWFLDAWRDGSPTLVVERRGQLRSTPLGRAVQAAAAQPPAPSANLDPMLRAQGRRRPSDVNRAMVGQTSLARRPRRRRPPARVATGVRISQANGRPFAGLVVQVILPTGLHAGTPAITDATGFVPVATPGPGLSLVTSADWELMPVTAASADYTPVDVIAAATPPDVTYHVPVPPGTVVELVARRAFYLNCPQCGRSYKTVEPAPVVGSRSTCPRDGFDLSGIEGAVVAAAASFTTPTSGQVPASTPTTLRSRGARSLATAHGTVTVYWDESRLLHLASGDYRLWGDTRSGVKTVNIIGRATWGAAAPVAGRSWEFHEAAIGVSPPYATSGVPNSENRPLATVFRWMTVHHTTDTGSASFATAVDVQRKHTDQPQNFTDVGYHYVVDTNGAIYEGRPLGIEGQHVELFNAANLGIALAGDFEPRLANLGSPDIPTAAQLASLDDLVDVLAARFAIRSVWTHLERKHQSGAGDTECPGARLIPHVTSVLRPAYPGPPP
jgi:hypothetical protein